MHCGNASTGQGANTRNRQRGSRQALPSWCTRRVPQRAQASSTCARAWSDRQGQSQAAQEDNPELRRRQGQPGSRGNRECMCRMWPGRQQQQRSRRGTEVRRMQLEHALISGRSGLRIPGQHGLLDRRACLTADAGRRRLCCRERRQGVGTAGLQVLHPSWRRLHGWKVGAQ